MTIVSKVDDERNKNEVRFVPLVYILLGLPVVEAYIGI